MKTPVLFIVFNRLHTVQQVFNSIKTYKPQQFFIAADGPRKEKVGEKEKCEAVRSWLLNNIDWDCEVKTLFQSENIGCGRGPSTAITWFFEHANEGIIIEDDVVPHIDFFEYAAILLNKYRHNKNIMAINSSNFQPQKRGNGSYYFSMQNGPLCAWASWKRAWEKFDYSLNSYPEKQIKKSMQWYKATKREQKWWLNIYRQVKSGYYGNSSWDYQFIFSIWAARAKSIVPNSNLSSNIGFGPDATHTTNPNAVTANRQLQGILPLEFSDNEEICRDADLYYHDFYYDKFVEYTPATKKIKRFIKKLIKLN
ncbi:MAG: nucleotide-diphospho-sugar transferase [Bacteroidales bacterium]|nr:nucleotide-diphospho-sugar transferase [Bacteroidales bacterium]